MAYVVCVTQRGLRPSEVTAVVEDVDGRKAFLRVEQDFIRKADGKTFLPVGIIGRDEEKGVLIELPHEADSGANRLWVHSSQVQEATERSTV